MRQGKIKKLASFFILYINLHENVYSYFLYFDLPTQLKKKNLEKQLIKKYGIRCEKIISPVIEVVNFNPMIKVFDMKNFSSYCNIFVQILIQIGTSEMFFYFIDNIWTLNKGQCVRQQTCLWLAFCFYCLVTPLFSVIQRWCHIFQLVKVGV